MATLRNYTQEQQALNHIADMIKYILKDDPSIEDPESLGELTQKTLDLMKITDGCENTLLKDTEFIEVVKNTPGVSIGDAVDDLTYVLLHVTIAKQTLMINNLLKMLNFDES